MATARGRVRWLLLPPRGENLYRAVWGGRATSTRPLYATSAGEGNESRESLFPAQRPQKRLKDSHSASQILSGTPCVGVHRIACSAQGPASPCSPLRQPGQNNALVAFDAPPDRRAAVSGFKPGHGHYGRNVWGMRLQYLSPRTSTQFETRETRFPVQRGQKRTKMFQLTSQNTPLRNPAAGVPCVLAGQLISLMVHHTGTREVSCSDR
jgi:hypothetical protein